MKKVLSVALASAMVLGMGANAFAISYSTGSSNEADWPTDFQFDGELFVTNKDGDIIEEASTALNDNESVDFEPGDVIWMPLYADNQLVYDAEYDRGEAGEDAVSSVRLKEDSTNFDLGTSEMKVYYSEPDEAWFDKGAADGTPNPIDIEELKEEGWNVPSNPKDGYVTLKRTAPVLEYIGDHYDDRDNLESIIFDGEERDVKAGSLKLYINGKRYTDVDEFNAALAEGNYDVDDVYATVDLVEVDDTDDYVGKPSVDEEKGERVYGHYTGNIDKNWSINLIERSSGVAELIEKAELYKATATDYASYAEYTDEIMPNAVYLKITLKDEWKTVDEETLTYYVYVADNDNKNNKTNEVWVSGTYVNNDWEYVDFTWTNNAAEAQLWKVKKGENGTAVFDFADKAFFTVKMYSGESMYLDLSTAYDKAIAGEMDAEADSFYKFDNDNANFSRTGELIIVTDDSSLVPYEIDEDGNFVEVDAKYVEDYAIAHTNKKVDGFVFSTKTLGNYVLSTEELGQEEQPAEETPAKPVTPSEPTTETPAPETSKPNPETGAEDFVGLAVSLAVVSVAAAGALALKK